MPNTEQLLYQTEKTIKALFLKILPYSQEKTCVKFLTTPTLKNIWCTTAFELTLK